VAGASTAFPKRETGTSFSYSHTGPVNGVPVSPVACAGPTGSPSGLRAKSGPPSTR
jgi:hypothetical protein